MAQETATIITDSGTQAVTVHTSARGTLTARDIVKGGVTAALTGGITAIERLISNGWDSLFTSTTGKAIALASLAGLVAYLIKNIFTDVKIVEVKP